MSTTALSEVPNLHGNEQQKDLHRRIRKAAMDMLSRREHSMVELQRKLLKKFSEYSVIDCVLTQLAEEKLLSDERFAEAYVRYRSAAGFGPERIKRELREKGVRENLVNQVLSAEHIDWMQIAARAYRKKFAACVVTDGDGSARGDSSLEASLDGNIRSGNDQSDNAAEKARRFRFMQYRGFSVEQFNQCCADDHLI